MRTDVKVGLICVFAVILAVVIYFVAQGNNHPREARAAGGAATQASPVSPAAAAPTMAVAPAMAPAAVPATGPAAGTMGELVLAQATPSGGPGSSLGGGMISPPTPGGSIGTPTPAPTGGAMVPNTTTMGAGGLSGGLPTGGGLLPTATAPAGGTNTTPGTIQIESGTGRTGGTDPFNRTGTNTGNPRTGGATGTGSGAGTGSGFGTGSSGTGRTGSSTGGSTTGGTGFGGGFGTNGGFPGATGATSTGGGTANFGTGIVGGTGGSTYTIQKGDMLGAIAKTHGTTVKAIEAANPGIDSTRLKVGKVINVPAASATGAGTGSVSLGSGGATTKPATTRPTTRPKPVAVAAGVKPGSSYTVKKGDTLAKIAVSVYGDKNAWRRIFRANRGEISSADVVPVGTVLRLPQ